MKQKLFMTISSKIFKDVKPPIIVQRYPQKAIDVKSAATPLHIFACSFIYYLLARSHNDINLCDTFFRNTSKSFIKAIDDSLVADIPFVQIIHEKSRPSTEPKNRLLQYLKINVYLKKSKEHKAIAASLAKTLASKLYSLSQENLEFKSQFYKENEIYKIEFKGYIKTYIVSEVIDYSLDCDPSDS